MKKLLLCFLAFYLINAATAQTWCPPGAKWHFKRGGTFGSFTNCDINLVYTNDTTVLGISCKKLVATSVGQIWYYNSSSPVATQYFNTYITHQSNGVLFLYNNDNTVFDTVVNFNANIGDQWLRPDGGMQFGSCINRWAFTVTDTAHVIINGFNLKKITVTNPSATNSSLTYTNVFLERILFTGGGTINYYNLFPTYCEIANSVTDIPMTVFSCYEDNVFPTYNATNASCSDFWTGVTEPGAETLKLRRYPNPVHNLLTIELQDAGRYDFNISDPYGRTWLLRKIQVLDDKLQLSLEDLSPGIYLLQVFREGRPVAVEKIVRN